MAFYESLLCGFNCFTWKIKRLNLVVYESSFRELHLMTYLGFFFFFLFLFFSHIFRKIEEIEGKFMPFFLCVCDKFCRFVPVISSTSGKKQILPLCSLKWSPCFLCLEPFSFYKEVQTPSFGNCSVSFPSHAVLLILRCSWIIHFLFHHDYEINLLQP